MTATVLDRLRGYRGFGVYLFVALALTVAAERRLSDAQFNAESASPRFESEDSLTGDEIQVRLIALNDGGAPTAPPSVEWETRDLSLASDHLVPRPTPDGPSPRAPPPRLFS
jgi:hypothetical protein